MIRGNRITSNSMISSILWPDSAIPITIESRHRFLTEHCEWFLQDYPRLINFTFSNPNSQHRFSKSIARLTPPKILFKSIESKDYEKNLPFKL